MSGLAQSGQLAPLSPLSSTVTTPTVTIGSLAATITRPTPVLAPGFVGVYQVNVTVPQGVPSGPAQLVLTTGGVSSNSVVVIIQ